MTITYHQSIIWLFLFFLFLGILPVSVHGSASSTTASIVSTTTSTVATSTIASATPPTPKLTSAQIEKLVRERFAKTPAMIGIAECESKFRQFTDSGNVLRGGMGGTMIGVFQFHEGSHVTKARALGFDIETVEGNLDYAEYLYTQLGTGPWSSCVRDVVPTQGSSAVQTLATDLSFGKTHTEVRYLQQLLNAQGFIIARSGSGSPGNETTHFGALTRDAVRAFQCAKKIVCTGDERTTGYGMVGGKTRATLLAGGAKTSASTAHTLTTSVKVTTKDTVALQKKIAELTKLVEELRRQLALMQ